MTPPASLLRSRRRYATGQCSCVFRHLRTTEKVTQISFSMARTVDTPPDLAVRVANVEGLQVGSSALCWRSLRDGRSRATTRSKSERLSGHGRNGGRLCRYHAPHRLMASFAAKRHHQRRFLRSQRERHCPTMRALQPGPLASTSIAGTDEEYASYRVGSQHHDLCLSYAELRQFTRGRLRPSVKRHVGRPSTDAAEQVAIKPHRCRAIPQTCQPRKERSSGDVHRVKFAQRGPPERRCEPEAQLHYVPGRSSVSS